MWPLGIVVVAPSFKHNSGFLKRGEPLLVQALISQFAVERFDMPVLSGSAKSDEVQLHLVLVSPNIKSLPTELGTVVDLNHLCFSSFEKEIIQNTDHSFAAEAGVSFNVQTLTGVGIKHIEGAK